MYQRQAAEHQRVVHGGLVRLHLVVNHLMHRKLSAAWRQWVLAAQMAAHQARLAAQAAEHERLMGRRLLDHDSTLAAQQADHERALERRRRAAMEKHAAEMAGGHIRF